MIATAHTPMVEEHEAAVVSSTPLAALVVSDDRSLQRRLNHYLREAGYRALHASSADYALALIESTTLDFLLVDTDLQSGDSLELCREAGATQLGAGLVKMLLQSNTTQVDFSDLLHAGVDDVLMKPPSYLELLARLRAGARTHEFRRRVELQLGLDPVTRFPNEQSFRLHLADLLDSGTRKDHSCLAITIDHFEQRFASDGMRAASELLSTMADLLGREKLRNEFISHWGQGRFFLVCEGLAGAEAAARAEELSQALRVALAEHQQSLPIAVSVGVSDSGARLSADQRIEQANEALQVAQISGGDCVSRYGEYDDEFSVLREQDRTGHVFQNTFAADLMTPCVLTLSESHSAAHAGHLLRRHRISAAPLVDGSGKCVGMVEGINLPDTPDKSTNKSVLTFRSAQAEMCGEETALGDIMQRFAQRETLWLIITRHGRPTGMISRDRLAEFSHPLTVESLQSQASSRVRARFEELLVPDCSA